AGGAEGVVEPEGRPHRVADLFVQLADLGSVGHDSIVPLAGRRAALTPAIGSGQRVRSSTARWAEEITAGMPMPSYAAPQTASPSTADTASRTWRTRSR